MVNIIKTLNPKPAENFNDEPLSISEPDIIVTKTNKGWKIDLNKSTVKNKAKSVYCNDSTITASN
jgi:DNA-directed RNA polymerase specialized sigma54-like protein